MSENNQNKYDRLYLTKYEKILRDHNIEENVTTFIDKAFYNYLEKKAGDINEKEDIPKDNY